MEHKPNRHVSDEEQHLWGRYKAALERSDFESVSVTAVAQDETPIHESRSRQIVATWENEGLVSAKDNANVASLTEYGRQVASIVEGMTSGESWR